MTVSASKHRALARDRRRSPWRRVGRPALLVGMLLSTAGAVLPAVAAADFGLQQPPAITWHQPLDIGAYESLGFDPFTGGAPFRGGIFTPQLTPDLRAGAHADLSVDLAFDNGTGDGVSPPEGSLRDVVLDLPAGFAGDPSNYPTCDPESFARGNGTGCTPGSQVGYVTVTEVMPQSAFAPVFNMATGPGEPAKFAFFIKRRVTIEVSARTDTDYGLTAKVNGVIESVNLLDLRLTLWGNPSDPAHDRLRFYPNGYIPFDENGNSVPNPSQYPQLPFLTAPPRCDAPLRSTVRLKSWPPLNKTATYETQAPARTGCDALQFDAGLKAAPSTAAAGQPTGLGIDLSVPQTNSMDSFATPNVKDVSVTLPDGVAISPGGADGLSACSDAQLATDSRAPERCPESSKVGTTTIETPVLDEPLLGNVYLGQQLSQDPASGDMYRLFLTAYAKGVRVKLKGNVVANPVTGRLTATFKQNPQLPFSNLKLDLKDGPRALLTNPNACGAGTVHLEASSYAGNVVSKDSRYVVDGNCPTGAFSPAVLAGTLDPFAGKLSPFTTTITRPDGQADLASLRLDLPPGLLGALGSVPICADAQAAAGTCGADSRLGSTSVRVGTGSAPFSLPGTVSLAGPYKGAPFSLSIAVPAKAGPLDLGLVVVRAPLLVDAARAQVSAPVDALPQIVGGVPLHYRTISVDLDRPGFMFNATNCTAAEVVATLTSTSGATTRQATRYQPQSCAALKLKPALKLTYSGALKKNQNPKLTADLTQTFGQAGLKRVAVTLPRISSLEPENAETLCSPAQLAARDCPAGSIVGRASAQTPALPSRLTGPVYLLQGLRKTASGKTVRTLPKLWLKLEGSGVPLDLYAATGVDARQRLVTTFTNVPDAPISDFRLEIDGGKRGILTAVQDPCQPTRRALARYTGHNGAIVGRTLQIAAPRCGIRVSTAAGRRGVRVSLANIAPGRLTLRGSGVRRATKTVKSGDDGGVTARLTKAAASRLRAGRDLRLRVTLTFDPKGAGKTRTIAREVIVRG